MTATEVVQWFDSMGIEVHFMRFVYFALITPHVGKNQDAIAHWYFQLEDNLAVDISLLIFIIMPMFLVALHFYTAPTKKYYPCKLQALLAPIAFIPMFLFKSWDILFMSVHVLFLNGYCAYYLVDTSEFYEP